MHTTKCGSHSMKVSSIDCLSAEKGQGEGAEQANLQVRRRRYLFEIGENEDVSCDVMMRKVKQLAVLSREIL